MKPDANADHRFDPDFVCGPNGLLEFLEFFNDDDNQLPEFATEQRDTNKSGIFVSVADDEALGVLVHRERGDKFRFAAGFQSEMKLLASIDNFFDDFAQLIDLDRKDAAILTAIAEFRDRVLKCEIDRLDAVAKQILEPNDEWKTQSARARLVYDFKNGDAAAIFLKGFGNDIAFGVDSEITAAPTIDIISCDRGLDVPVFHLFLARRPSRERHNDSARQLIKRSV